MIIPENRQLNADDLEKASEMLSAYEPHSIRCVNWPEKFPEKPQVDFRMAHNGTELFIRFTVEENTTLAAIREDNGEVWTDSCVEFFLALDDAGYYNFEFTCIGKALLGFRKERPNAIHATPEIMQSIKRFSTLGKNNFGEKNLGKPWELTVAIPVSALFKHNVRQWKGLTAYANLYKCGDNLSKPHFLSWAPIDTDKPDFHVPRCFTQVTFS
ncbi:MAG: hypothetical protein K2L23_09175 [Odoribacter sp.]|nr:hypothetical protein [Odoribacter sp.]